MNWIKIEDRLPDSARVIFFVPNFDTYLPESQIKCSYWSRNKNRNIYITENNEVLWPSHWMPLPEEPTE